MMDVVGRELDTREIDLIPGKNKVTLTPGNSIAKGIYFLQVKINGQLKAVKLVKGD